MISGLIEGDDWRSDWTDKDYSEDLKKLDDPTPEHQRQQRNKETVIKHELKPEKRILKTFMVTMNFLLTTFQENPLIVMWKRVTKPNDHNISKTTFCITQIRIRINFRGKG